MARSLLPCVAARNQVTSRLLADLTDKPGRAIKVGAHPAVITVTPNGRTVYVISQGSGTVTPIRTATDKAGKPIKVGKDPNGMALVP